MSRQIQHHVDDNIHVIPIARIDIDLSLILFIKDRGNFI